MLQVSTWMISMKYLIHTVDLTTQNSMENKAAYFLYLELVANGVKVAIYSVFMFIMVAIHTFPLFAIRPMYLALKAFKKASYDVIMSRRAIRLVGRPSVSRSLARSLARCLSITGYVRRQLISIWKSDNSYQAITHINQNSCQKIYSK